MQAKSLSSDVVVGCCRRPRCRKTRKPRDGVGAISGACWAAVATEGSLGHAERYAGLGSTQPAACRATLARVHRVPGLPTHSVCGAHVSRSAALLFGALLLGCASGARTIDEQCRAMTGAADVVRAAVIAQAALFGHGAPARACSLEECLWLPDGPSRMRLPRDRWAPSAPDRSFSPRRNDLRLTDERHCASETAIARRRRSAELRDPPGHAHGRGISDPRRLASAGARALDPE